MDHECMNHYEKQLYTVFKTFDVDNEEALDRAAVLQLCDALQLEARGAALVDSLFECRTDRVTFASFRNGLLGVLGAEPPPPPSSDPTIAPATTSAPVSDLPAHSDEDSSGCEVAPKFVYGSKKYGRRSRPSRGDDEPPAPRAASASRLDTISPRPRARYKRSASAMEARAADLDHDRRITATQAIALCRDLRMDGIDRRLIESIFEDRPDEETTVGEFFDRLNASLTTSIAAAGDELVPPHPTSETCDDDEATLPGEIVVEAWENAGVRRPRRLLAELGFAVTSLRPRDLQRALDDELRALTTSPDDSAQARPLLQLAALALSRLCHARAVRRAAATAAERDKLRADLAEANRRAQLLALDVDENHARLEVERETALRQLEARHAEALRTVSAEGAIERERAAAARAELEVELARRSETETRFRAELAALTVRAEQLEKRASAAEERATTAERERARCAAEALEAAARGGQNAGRERAAADALARQLDELRVENTQLRDRADELQAALEAPAPRATVPAAATSWRDEAELDTDEPLNPDRSQECESSSVSIERQVASCDLRKRLMELGAEPEVSECEGCKALRGTLRALAAETENASEKSDSGGELIALRAQLDEANRKHEVESTAANDLITELEASVSALREEYERCEEYWAGKLREERSAAADEARAADDRLADLLARVAEYERAFLAPRLPPLHETALEDQYQQLDKEFESYREEKELELAETRKELDSVRDELGTTRDELAAARRPRPRDYHNPAFAPRPASDGEAASKERIGAGDSDLPDASRVPRSASAEAGPQGTGGASPGAAPGPAGDTPPYNATGTFDEQLRHHDINGMKFGGTGCMCAALWARCAWLACTPPTRWSPISTERTARSRTARRSRPSTPRPPPASSDRT